MGARRRQLKALASSLAPDGRAKRKALNSWRGQAEDVALMRRAASSLVLQGLRKGHNSWAFRVAEKHALRQQLLGAVNSLRLVGSRRALNAWAAMAAEVGAAKRQAAGALKSLSPHPKGKALAPPVA